MPTPTYDLIASNVLTSSASSVTFSSIPSTYRDLVLVAKNANNNTYYFYLRFNGDSGANYSDVMMFGNGSSAFSNSSSGATEIDSNGDGQQGGLIIFNIMDYSATDKHKTVLIRSGSSTTDTAAVAGRWANTAAINSITITGNVNAAAGSSFYLYGIVS